jgi:hypothetical protein
MRVLGPRGQKGERSRDGAMVRGEQEPTRVRARTGSQGGVRARDRESVEGHLGWQRAPMGGLCRTRSVRAAASCEIGVREVVKV